MKPCLIVYYSRSGVTAGIAQSLARLCGADIEEIRDARPRDGAAGFLRSAWQGWRRQPSGIMAPQRHPADYPFIVLGTPVWAGQMSAPMRAYILQQREHFRRVALFCTMAGSGGQGVLMSMADLCNKLPAATLHLRRREVLADRHAAALAAFADELAVLRHDEEAAAPAHAPN